MCQPEAKLPPVGSVDFCWRRKAAAAASGFCRAPAGGGAGLAPGSCWGCAVDGAVLSCSAASPFCSRRCLSARPLTRACSSHPAGCRRNIYCCHHKRGSCWALARFIQRCCRALVSSAVRPQTACVALSPPSVRPRTPATSRVLAATDRPEKSHLSHKKTKHFRGFPGDVCSVAEKTRARRRVSTVLCVTLPRGTPQNNSAYNRYLLSPRCAPSAIAGRAPSWMHP